MHLYTFESWFTLLVGFLVYVMGLRIFWLDPKNRMYQALMVTTFFLAIQNFILFFMAQTTDLAIAQKLKPWLDISRYLIVIFICTTSLIYAKQYIPRELTRLEKTVLYFTLIISICFLFFQLLTSSSYGDLVLSLNNQWAVIVPHPIWKDWQTMGFFSLIYSLSIYYVSLPFKLASNKNNKLISGFIFIALTMIFVGTFTKNCILPIFFQTLTILNESAVTLVGVFFCRFMIVNFQVNSLKSNYVIPNLLKNMTNWFVLTDSNFNINKVNVAFLDDMGKNEIEWKNIPIYSLFEEEKWLECKEKVLALKSDQTIECEFELTHNGQSYYLRFAIAPIINKFKTWFFYRGKIIAYAFVGTNLSQFKKTENQMKKYAEKLETSIHALESFAFIASHDLREPIRNIGSFAGLLRRELGSNVSSNSSEYLDYIDKSVKGMNQLVNSIMAVSRVGQHGLHFEQINMNDLLRERKKQFDVLFKKNNVTITTEAMSSINGDRQLISQLIQNLIENSIKYNTSSQPEIHIYSTSAIEHQDHILIKIEDNGIGIEPEYREQVFQMFKRLHSRQVYEGTGIGLAICKRIMELHEGQIWIEDTRTGQGATFVLCFPEIG